jgi:hypothetical protein
MSDYRPTVVAHVIWHPACAAGGDYARALFAHLFEDPEDLGAHGLRIPVRLWRSTGDAGSGSLPPPAVPPLDDAARTIVVVLVDEQFMAARGWNRFLDELAAAARAEDVLIGVSVDEIAMELNSPLFERNLVRLHEVDGAIRETFLVNRVTHALCRLVAGSPEPVKVFVSHAKKDGVPIAKAVRKYLHDGSGLTDFFDAQDLLEGTRWKDQIRGEAARNVLLAVRTDAYASREWCRTEILEAKLAGSPIVVLDALKSFEARGFPYLGNGPSVRWTKRSPAALEGLLRVVLYETLRFRYFPLRVADLCRAYGLPAHRHILTAPPELLTVLRRRASALGTPLVYPDPPLGTDELLLVSEFAPDLGMITPTALIARQ